MKIIATIKEGYLIEASDDELSNLMGYSSNYRRKDTRNSRGEFLREFQIGDNLPIHKMYEHLFRMANLEKELMEISAKLKAASDFVDTSLPTVQHINKDKVEEP